MPPMTRREALAAAGVAALSAAVVIATPAPAEAASAGTGFLHGVASGDPYPATSAELSARLARDIDAYGTVIRATVK